MTRLPGVVIEEVAHQGVTAHDLGGGRVQLRVWLKIGEGWISSQTAVISLSPEGAERLRKFMEGSL